jgi:predicted MFS family arabinose efflux permease
LRRRPVLIWADLGRFVVLGSIPVAFAFGALTFGQILVVAALASILTTFFDAADNAYLPTVVDRDQLVDANGALAASGSAAEFAGFGISGFLVQVLTAPIAIAVDAGTFLVSALLLGTIRAKEDPPPPREDREPVLSEIRDGVRLVRRDPLLRAFIGAQMSLAVLYGIFGATWLLFVLDRLGIGPAAIGVIAGVGGFASFLGAIAVTRATRQWGVGRVAIGAVLVTAVGNAFVPLAPDGLPLVAIGCLVMAQLVGDSSATVYEITEVSVRQTVVRDRALGRVSSVFHVATGLVQLVATLAAGLLAASIGLRTTMWLAPFGALMAAWILWRSPVRQLRELPEPGAPGLAFDPVAVELDEKRQHPPGS